MGSNDRDGPARLDPGVLPRSPRRARQGVGDRRFYCRRAELPGKTWLDLLRPIFPDIAAPTKAGATAKDIIDLHSIGVGDDSWINCGDDIRLTTAEVDHVRLAGQSRLIMTLSVADDCVALFDD
jgi:hypothetical protein